MKGLDRGRHKSDVAVGQGRIAKTLLRTRRSFHGFPQPDLDPQLRRPMHYALSYTRAIQRRFTLYLSVDVVLVLDHEIDTLELRRLLEG